MLDWFGLLGFLAVGKICIYTLQVFPPTAYVSKFLDQVVRVEFFQKLTRCDFCLGVWVYAFWSFIFGYHLPVLYVPIISEFTLGSICSFGMHLMSLGWTSKFGIIQLEDDHAIQ